MTANEGSFDSAWDQTENQEPDHCAETGSLFQDAIVCIVRDFGVWLYVLGV